MPSIVFSHVDFAYQSPHAEVFRDLSLLIDTRWRTGVVGRNGRGKSTLLRLIAGLLQPSAGLVEVPVGVRYFSPAHDGEGSTLAVIRASVAPFDAWEARMAALLAVDPPGLDEYDRIHETFQRAGGYDVDARIECELTAMGLDPTLLGRPFDSLSGGERTRALICGLFLDPHSFALIDEPTNHLDADGRDRLARYLAGKPGFLLVSHDRHLLDGAVDHMLSLNRGDVRINRGDYSQWRTNRDAELASEAHARVGIERDVRRLRKAALDKRRNADAKESEKYGGGAFDKGFIGHRAARQMRRALTVERRITVQLEERQDLLRNHEKVRDLKVCTAPGRPGRLVLVQNLTLAVDGRSLFENLSFSLERGARVGLTGRNGAGKSLLLDVIGRGGAQAPCHMASGLVQLAAGISIARAYQEPLWRDGMLRARLADAGLAETRFRELLDAFGVEADLFGNDLGSFSPGQLRKVDLCRSLMAGADLLIWDEPLNYLDIEARERLETAILRDGPTLLFVEHDRVFVDRIATLQIVLGAQSLHG